MLDLLIWLFENKDGEVISGSPQIQSFSYFWAAQRDKAKVLRFFIHTMKRPYKFQKDRHFLPKYGNLNKQKIKTGRRQEEE